MPLDTLLQFKHIEKPKGVPMAELVALFELLGLSEGLIRNENTHEQAVIQLTGQGQRTDGGGRHRRPAGSDRASLLGERADLGRGAGAASAEARRSEGLPGRACKPSTRRASSRTSPGASRRSRPRRRNLDLVKQVEDSERPRSRTHADDRLPGDCHRRAASSRPVASRRWKRSEPQWRAKLLDPQLRGSPDFRQIINRALQKAKDDYKTTYLNLHKKARLGINEDEKKKELLKDPRLDQLKKLAAGISLLPHASLTELQTRLSKLTPCFTLVKDDLDASPICPHCNFRPQEETLGASGQAVLTQIDDQLDTMLENWRKTLLDNLADPTVEEEHQPPARWSEGGRGGLPEVEEAPRQDRARSGPGDAGRPLRSDRHPGAALRLAGRGGRQRRPLHGGADFASGSKTFLEGSPVARRSSKVRLVIETGDEALEARSDHAPVHPSGLARPGLGRSHLRPSQQERLLHGPEAHPGRAGRRPGGQGGGPVPGRTRRLAAAVFP